MDYELFLETNLTIRSLAEIIEGILIELGNEKVTVQNDEEEIYIGISYFSLALEIEDISDIAFVRKYYNINVNVTIRVQLFGNSFYDGLKNLFKVIGKLMKLVDGNLLFLENGSDQLLRKESGQLIVKNDLDHYQIKYLTKSLLRLLDHPYVEHNLLN